MQTSEKCPNRQASVQLILEFSVNVGGQYHDLKLVSVVTSNANIIGSAVYASRELFQHLVGELSYHFGIRDLSSHQVPHTPFGAAMRQMGKETHTPPRHSDIIVDFAAFLSPGKAFTTAAPIFAIFKSEIVRCLGKTYVRTNIVNHTEVSCS
jgi:hypothetical protein